MNEGGLGTSERRSREPRAETFTVRRPNEDVMPDDAGRRCPICEAAMYEQHCKYVCPNHGVVYDCADTFY